MKKNRKAFRELLNKEDLESQNPISFKEKRFGQRTRLYGDYLYHQDRERFEVNYQEWLKQ